jgi:hypothetical protein
MGTEVELTRRIVTTVANDASSLQNRLHVLPVTHRLRPGRRGEPVGRRRRSEFPVQVHPHEQRTPAEQNREEEN